MPTEKASAHWLRVAWGSFREIAPVKPMSMNDQSPSPWPERCFRTLHGPLIEPRVQKKKVTLWARVPALLREKSPTVVQLATIVRQHWPSWSIMSMVWLNRNLTHTCGTFRASTLRRRKRANGIRQCERIRTRMECSIVRQLLLVQRQKFSWDPHPHTDGSGR